ncbi:hypothetical protein CB1_000513022 [Camelus ferus]|nr:hypothetical protein CB1_000513022 [Camelus ferus]
MRYGHTEGHTDVCFDDSGSCIVTCGSDGDVRIWEDLDDDDPKSINVGEKAYSCALKNGKLVTAVSNNTIQVHTFPEGVPDGILTRFTTNANHVIFNGDGTKIAAGSRVKNEKGHAICGLSWHPTCGQIAYTDAEGNLGLLENVCDPSGKMSSSKVSSRVEKDYSDLFDGDDRSNAGDFLNDNAVEMRSFSKGIINDEEDDDDLMLASGRPRQRSHILDDDENSVDVTMLKNSSSLLKEEEEDDQAGGIQNLPLLTSQKPFYNGPMPTPRQKPFQSGSTPLHLTHRFMEQYWRSVMFHNYLDYLAKNGYAYEESTKNQAIKEQQELLMKMLALSCKLEREFRCVELANLMTQNAVNLAIKYASRSRRLILAQRLSELAVEKAAELAATQAEEEEEEEEDFRKKLNAGYSNTATEWSQPRLGNQAEEDTEDSGEADDIEEKPETHNHGQNSFFKNANSSDVLAIKSDEADIIKEGMVRFRVLSTEERKAWAAKAKGETVSDGAEAKKRKRVVDRSRETENQTEKAKENLNLPKKQKPLDLSTNQKLSAFAFKQE